MPMHIFTPPDSPHTNIYTYPHEFIKTFDSHVHTHTYTHTEANTYTHTHTHTHTHTLLQGNTINLLPINKPPISGSPLNKENRNSFLNKYLLKCQFLYLSYTPLPLLLSLRPVTATAER